MHEFSIAQNIMDIAITELKKTKASTISEMELEIGVLAGVEYQALEFALEAIMKEQSMKSTKVLINKPEGKAKCRHCCREFKTDSMIIQCPFCNAFENDIIQGQELRLKSIVVD